MNKKILSLLFLTSLTLGAQAKVKLPHLVSDNMIIQQQTNVRCGVGPSQARRLRPSRRGARNVVRQKLTKRAVGY